ncbi:MAG: amino acid permease, partial [Ferruginibacter sp.]|nr:amino acid permease [Ferruginibacter sp.]
ASAAVLIIYLGVVLATLKLRKRNKDATEKYFRVPGGALVPVLAAGGILWLLSNLTRIELIGIALFNLAFALMYLIIKMFKNKIR